MQVMRNGKSYEILMHDGGDAVVLEVGKRQYRYPTALYDRDSNGNLYPAAVQERVQSALFSYEQEAA